MSKSNRFVLLEKWIAFLVLFLVLLISNRMTWLCVLEIDMPLFGCWYGSRTNELFLYIMALVLVILSLTFNGEVRQKYYEVWQRSKWLILVLLFCVLSLVWTIDWIRTVYKSLLVIISTLVAVYLGTRYRPHELPKIFVVFSFVVISLSYLLVLFLPDAAIMSTPWHTGSWRGAFSHRNYMGSIIAYGNIIILIIIFVGKEIRLKSLYILFYFLSWGLIVLSRSATGMILAVLLNVVLFTYLAFLKWGQLLRPRHYKIIIGILAIFGIALVVNMNRLLGILGRDVSFSGRIPLWKYLTGEVLGHNLWLGYGFGAIWDYLVFRTKAAITLGWPFEVVNSHNGFVDIFLDLGLLGLILFLLVTWQVIYRVFLFIRKEQTLASAWLLVTVIYVIVSNITISFFFNFETFHWVLWVIVASVTSLPNKVAENTISQP